MPVPLAKRTASKSWSQTFIRWHVRVPPPDSSTRGGELSLSVLGVLRSSPLPLPGAGRLPVNFLEPLFERRKKKRSIAWRWCRWWSPRAATVQVCQLRKREPDGSGMLGKGRSRHGPILLILGPNVLILGRLVALLVLSCIACASTYFPSCSSPLGPRASLGFLYLVSGVVPRTLTSREVPTNPSFSTHGRSSTHSKFSGPLDRRREVPGFLFHSLASPRCPVPSSLSISGRPRFLSDGYVRRLGPFALLDCPFGKQ